MAADSSDNPLLTEAARLVRDGDPARAEDLGHRAVADAEAAFGAHSPEYAAAQNDRGRIFAWVGKLDRALDAFRTACALEFPDNETATHDRLSYRTNLGLTLAQTDRLDEAEAVFRDGLAEREHVYGRDHPGYAFGLEPLVHVWLNQGRFDEALAGAEEAVATYRRHTHRRLAAALAFRAEVLKAAGSARPPFADTDELPDDMIDELAAAVFASAGTTNPAVSAEVLADLVPFLAGRLGPASQATINARSLLANALGELGRYDEQAAVIEAVIRAYRQAGRPEEALRGRLGLALCHSAAGRPGEAERAYAEAVAEAAGVGEFGLRSQVRRNYGLFLAERGRRDEAEKALRAAAADAKWGADAETHAKALLALGVFLADDGRGDEARPLLEEALRRFGPAHPDAAAARRRLDALA